MRALGMNFFGHTPNELKSPAIWDGDGSLSHLALQAELDNRTNGSESLNCKRFSAANAEWLSLNQALLLTA